MFDCNRVQSNVFSAPNAQLLYKIDGGFFSLLSKTVKMNSVKNIFVSDH